jgi:hypothetical protein
MSHNHTASNADATTTTTRSLQDQASRVMDDRGNLRSQ